MRIAVEFSGWIVGEPEDYSFQAIEEGVKPIINGVEYCALSEEERSRYIINNLAKQIDESLDNNWESIVIEVEDD